MQPITEPNRLLRPLKANWYLILVLEPSNTGPKQQRYLEVKYDGPDETEHDGGPPVDQIRRVDVHELDALAREEAQRRVSVGQKVGAAEDAPALHGLVTIIYQ